jgi:DNA-binding CsgD family transcriptional regulator
VGKSRLAREVSALARAEGFHVLFGRAVRAETPVPFRPLAGALLSHFRHHGPPTAEELGPYRPVLGRLLPEWHSAADPRAEGASGRPAVVLAEAVERLLGVVAGPVGCLVVLEDLQWADPETLAVVEYLADALTTERVVVLCTVRSEEPSPARSLAHALEASRSTAVFDLTRLGEAELERMAAACLEAPRAPKEVVDFLCLWADGLPFLVEELLAGAMGAGALVSDADGWRLAPAATPTVPVTFAESVQRRLAGLGPAAGPVLRAAAVLGRRFDWTLVAAAESTPDPTVLEVLRGAVGAQLLVAGLSGSHFRFRHALTRDAVLADLLPAERVRISARLLQAVEDAHPGLPGEWAALAAELAEQAGERGRTAELLLEGGRRSLAVGALGSAENMLDRARKFAADAATRADVDEIRLEVLSLAGKTADALAVGEELVAAFGRLGAPAARRTHAQLFAARAAVTGARWATAERHLADVRRHAEATSDDVLAARVDVLAAQAAIGQADPDAAIPPAEAGLEAAERLGAYELACEALEVLGRCARQRDPESSERVFSRALRLAEEHDLVVWRIRAMAELAANDFFRDGTMTRLRAAREQALATGTLSVAAHLDLYLSLACKDRYEHDEAIVCARRCAELARRLGMNLLHAIGMLVEQQVHALQGDRAGVESLFARAMEIAPDDPVACGIGWSGRAHLAVIEEDHPRARRDFDRAIGFYRQVSAPPADPAWGMWLLLATSAGRDVAAERAEVLQVGATVNYLVRGLCVCADAVGHGRAGRAGAAAEALAEAETLLAPSEIYRHLALRIAAPAAIADGWGDPERWTREALGFFEAKNLSRAADACRALLRTTGAPVPRRGKAAVGVPAEVAAAGVTQREVEVLLLLGQGLPNREIAERLYLSPRTVERHIANIGVKVGAGTRAALVAYAARILG